MITLTAAHSILQTLGDLGSGVDYQKIVVNPITYDNIAKKITATVRLTSTVNTSLPAILGTLIVSHGGGFAELVLPQLDYQAHVALTGGQLTAVQTWLTDSQEQVESGLITISVAAGVQSAGT